MSARESLICEESLSQRVGHFEQAEIGRPQFDPRLWIEERSNIAMGRTGSKVLNEDARIDYKACLSDLDLP